MKSYIKCIIVIFILIIPSVLSAQIFGIKGGLTLSKMVVKDDNLDIDDSFVMKPGFLVGPTIEFPLSELTTIETGLLLTSKGFKDKYEEDYQGGFYKSTTTLNLLYLDVPVIIKRKFEIAEKTHIYAALGPYFGIGLDGKSKSVSKSNNGEETYTSDIEWGTDEESDMLRRLDAGISMGGGMSYGALDFGIYYNLGLANISAYHGEGTKIKNKVLQFSIAYKFLKN